MSKEVLPYIVIYTDGACSGNPGPGGWGAVVLGKDGQVREMGNGESPTTNNRMEVRAALEALIAVRDTEGPIHLYTDSTYLIRGITQWVWGWKRKGWKTAEGADVQNRDLWEKLLAVTSRRGKGEIDWRYVRGHRGHAGNERCDRIAVAFSKGERPGLYRGPVNEYRVDILTFPDPEALPDMKPKTEKVKAHSYLSYLDGEVLRHADWPSCEKRVKGKPAKFKKAASPADEKEILASWGVSESKVKNDPRGEGSD